MRDEKEERKEFYFKVAALIGTEPEKGKNIDDTTTATKWHYGFSSYPQSPAVVIHTDSLRYAENWHIGWREKTLEDGPDGGKLLSAGRSSRTGATAKMENGGKPSTRSY